jgi:hypothetical protein
MTKTTSTIPLFASRNTVSTPAAMELLIGNDIEAQDLLRRHFHGDYGNICFADKAMNGSALKDGNRILSVYDIKTRDGIQPVYVLTEALQDVDDNGRECEPFRNVTTILLPSEY